MSPDDRTPVIAGVGQRTWRDRAAVPPPLELMALAVVGAARDVGEAPGQRLLRAAGTIAVVDLFSWPVPDPGRALAQALDLQPRETVRAQRGGTGPIELLGDAAGRIARGEADVVVLAGAECVTPMMRAAKEGRSTGWPMQPEGTQPGRLVGHDAPPGHPAELAASLIAPVTYYPWLEGAVRARAGRPRREHELRLAELWARFAEVARDNEHAWQREVPDAAALASSANGNRLVAEPYRKLLTANIQVDQAAALIVCSRSAAIEAGADADRLVEVRATASAHDHWFCAQRDALDRSPALRATTGAVLRHAGASADDVALLDLYSCFPYAVEVAGTELGIDVWDDPRSPTVTGGLTFAGGPGNAYVLHSLAAMTEALRDHPGELGLATAVGWYLTKHAAAVLAGPQRAPGAAFAHHAVQDEVDAQPKREIAGDADEDAEIEAATVLFDRDEQPTVAIASALLADGRRAVGKLDDADALAEIVASDWLGRSARFSADRFSLRA